MYIVVSPSITSVPWTLETSFEDKISAGFDTEAKIFLADAGMLADTWVSDGRAVR